MSELPVIDEAYTRRIYDSLTAMEVELDSDPLQYGPKRLNGKVAATRRHLSRCQQIYMQMADDLQRLNRAHRALKLDYDLQMQDMLSNDPDVRSNKNIRDREAVANTKLRVEREQMSQIEMAQSDIESVLSIVKAKREDLKDIQGRIRDQVKLCQEEIGLGAGWGSRPPPNVTDVISPSRPRVNIGALEQHHQTTVTFGSDTVSGITDLEAYVLSETGGSDSDMPDSDTPNQEADTVGEVAPPIAQDSEPESVLPDIPVSTPPVASTTKSEIDNFFDNLDTSVVATKSKSGVSQASELNFDDLLSLMDDK